MELSDRALEHLASLPTEGRYELKDEIGRGGMGVVYRAFDHGLERDVALKVVQASLPQSVEDRMRREAVILARLEHPGIVPIHDAGLLPDGRFFYAMKLVRGRQLSPQGSLQERLRTFLTICDAVSFAHASGVIHRDLKPANIMIGQFGEVLVLDWGVARFDTSEAPAAGSAVGTRHYAAPEQAHGDSDARSDVYSLGKLLAYLTPGESSPHLKSIASKATQSLPEHRYTSVRELAQDVVRFLDQEPVSSYRERWWERGRRVAQRHQLVLSLLLAYLLMRSLLIFFSNR